MRTNIPPNSMGILEAKKQVAALKLNPQDYGFSSWTNQALANALNITIRGSVNKSKILAYPGGSTDYVTGKLLTKEQTEQKANTYNKDSAIAEVKALGTKVYNALYSPFYSTALTPLGRQEAEKAVKAETQQVYERVKNFVSQTEFNSYFNSSLQIENTNQLARYQELHKPDFLSTAIPLVTSLGAGFVTGGLPLTQQLAVNSAISLAQGAKPEDVLKSALGTIAANEVPEFLKTVNAIVPESPNDALYKGLVNAERQATYALFTGQDPTKAALAGFAGASVGSLATDDAAIQRATGEYVQAIAAGRSPTDAMMSALSGFAQTERVKAQERITQEQQKQEEAKKEKETAGAPGTTTQPPSGGTRLPEVSVTGTKSDLSLVQPTTPAQPAAPTTPPAPKLPEVTVTATKDNISLLPPATTTPPAAPAKPSLPEVTVTAGKLPETTVTADKEASNIGFTQPSTVGPAKEKAPAKTAEERARDALLLNLLTPSPFFRVPISGGKSAIQTSAPGSEALAQALRIGDVGAPIFGRDEEGRRAGWNLRSLRYMGNSEA